MISSIRTQIGHVRTWEDVDIPELEVGVNEESDFLARTDVYPV